MQATATQTTTATNWRYDATHELWVLKSYLSQSLNISENTLIEGMRDYRAKGKGSWQYTTEGKTTWFHYDSIAAPTRIRIEERLKAADVHAFASLEILRGSFETYREADDARHFLTLPVKKGGRAFTEEQANDLAFGCAILRGLFDMMERRVWRLGMRTAAKTVIYEGATWLEWVATQIKTWRLYGLNVGNARRLRIRIKDFQTKGRASMITEKMGNTSAQKRTKQMVETAIVLMGSAYRPTVRDVRRELERRFQLVLTDSTVNTWLHEPENCRRWMPAREGAIYARKKLRSYIGQGNADYPDQIWYIDTTTVQLWVEENGKAGKVPMNRVTVLDTYSKMRVGVAYGVTETNELVWQALYFAMKATGRMPTELHSDNGGANTHHDIKAKLCLLGIHQFTNQPHRPTAHRDIEHDQHLHERQLQRHLLNFSGGNFTGRGQQMRFNPDNLAQLKKSKQLPNWMEAISHDYQLYMESNYTPHEKTGKSPFDLYNELKDHPKRRVCQLEQLVIAGFDFRKDLYLYQNGQLLIESEGERFTYWVGTPMVEDYEFKKRYDGNRFKVRFSADDPSVIALCSLKDEFISLAVRKHGFSRAITEKTAEERLALRQNLDNEKRYYQEGKQQFAELVEATEAAGELTHIDWNAKSKTQQQIEGLQYIFQQVENVPILNRDRQRLLPKSQKADPSPTPSVRKHLFAADSADDLLT